MANPVFNFLYKHYSQNSNVDLDSFIDIHRLLREYDKFKKYEKRNSNIANFIYTILENTESILEYNNDAYSIVNIIGIERTYKLMRKVYINTWEKCSELARSIYTHANKKSQKYYVKKVLIEYVPYCPEDFEDTIENLYKLGLLNTLCKMYIKWQIDCPSFIEWIGDVSNGNITCVKQLLQKIWNNDIGDTTVIVSSIKIAKFMNKHFRNNIDSIYSDSNIKSAVFAKNVKLSCEFDSDFKHKSIALTMRKFNNKSSKFNIVEKIVQIFTHRNMLKLILYHI